MAMLRGQPQLDEEEEDGDEFNYGPQSFARSQQTAGAVAPRPTMADPPARASMQPAGVSPMMDRSNTGPSTTREGAVRAAPAPAMTAAPTRPAVQPAPMRQPAAQPRPAAPTYPQAPRAAAPAVANAAPRSAVARGAATPAAPPNAAAGGQGMAPWMMIVAQAVQKQQAEREAKKQQAIQMATQRAGSLGYPTADLQAGAFNKQLEDGEGMDYLSTYLQGLKGRGARGGAR